MKIFQFVPYFFSIALFITLQMRVYAEQSIEGDCNVQSYGDDNKIVLNCSNFRRVAVINNAHSILVLKRLKDTNNPYSTMNLSRENHLGIVEAGAKVQILGEFISSNPVLSFTKIRILEGRLKGQTGWVASSTIQIVDSSE
jgi:hypothetical protein